MANEKAKNGGGNDEGFPVDECFGMGIDRPLAELVESGVDNNSHNNNINSDELVSFEEFIRSTVKRKKEGKPADESNDDGFFDIVLDGANVPEDPKTEERNKSTIAGKGGNKRSELYAVRDDDTTEDKIRISPSTTTLRHSFCPTVGDGSGWLNRRGRRESQDSAAYGYEAYEPSDPAPKISKMEHQRAANAGGVRNSASRHSMRNCPPAEERGHEQQVDEPEDHRQMAIGDLVISKFLCCFRALNPTQMAKGRKCGEGKAEVMVESSEQQQQQQKCYSWDKRETEQWPNPADFCCANLMAETRVKEPGQLNGQAFQIENCVDSMIALLDRTASITVDDSRNCVILAGPCQGSIFLRNCTNVLILAVCQQFRTRDCRHLFAHLFCATAPTIEDTDLVLAPLHLNYSGLQTQIQLAGLSPFVNRWSQVHNFTPESGKCRKLYNTSPTAASMNCSNGDPLKRLHDFLALSPTTEQWNLSVGNARESRIFVDGIGARKHDEQQQKQQEKALVLIRPSGDVAGLRFYAESVEFVHELLDWHAFSLVAMHDIDLRAGEWETIMQTKQQKGKQQNGKLITIELDCPETVKNAAEFVMEAQGSKSSISAQLVGNENIEQYRMQLYRLAEIRQSI